MNIPSFRVIDTFRIYRERLSSVGVHEPLTKFSLFLVILLDIFIFSTIYTGIEDTTRVIATPESYASYQCTDFIRSLSEKVERESVGDVLVKIEHYYSYDSYKYRSSYDDGDYGTVQGNAEGCRMLREKLSAASTSTGLTAMISELRETQKSIEWALAEKSTIESSYDTALLEKIAEQDRDKALTPESADTAKARIVWIDQKVSELRTRESGQITALRAHPLIAEIYETVDSYGTIVLSSYDRIAFWYPIKVFGAQILFILPLLLITLWWSHVSVVRERGVQTLVSSHLLGIIAIFILLKTLELVYDILPHALLERIFDWLTLWNIVGLWYYALILIAIGVVLGLVYLVQKKLFSRERLRILRSERHQCLECAARLVGEGTHCIRCGYAQNTVCPSCKKETSATAKYCGHCGKVIEAKRSK